jgi:hypothetical protein
MLVSFSYAAKSAASIRVLDPKVYYLGTPGFAEWEEFEKSKPHGRRLDIKFNAKANGIAHTLLIRQRQVKFRWPVLLNNQRIGNLLSIDSTLVHTITVPPGKLREGENTLSIVAPKATDDIEVGPIRLASVPSARLFPQLLTVSIKDADNGKPLPCRITITDESGALAALHPASGQRLAHRPGVIYVSHGQAHTGLLPGRYTVYASRGFEYSVAKTAVQIEANKPASLNLKLRQEVPTPGLVATDTHIHTLTRSGHGDSSEEERMHTIAGEGIELAVATDHNHHADYRPVQEATGTSAFFTSVIGNEVTTKTGHFNAFPIAPKSPVPDYKLGDWTKLMAAMRATPGVRVVVLNHPRNTHSGFSPVAAENFNPVTGRNLYGAPYTFDAMEVVTSAAMQSDIMAPYRDWFAMLNWGHNITGVGSSDTHDVTRFILGQARTYVECPDDAPAKIDVAKACESFRNMRAYISMGLLVKMKVDDKFRVGDLATGKNDRIKVAVQVLGPSWASADQVNLYANGHLIRTQAIKPGAAIQKANLTWNIPRPAHDVHLVAMATGPGITAPFWESPRPYQPTSKKHDPRVQGATNPIFVDGDGDEKYTPPRIQAQRLFSKHKGNIDLLLGFLRPLDQAVATQLAGLMHDGGHDLREPNIQNRIAKIDAAKAGFAAFVDTLPKKTP